MKEQTRKFKFALSLLAGTLVLCVAGFLIAGILQLEVFKRLGPWGDFFGGTLNPILASATILALLYTIYLQRQANDLQKEELVLTREELSRSADALENQIKTLERQNFEATFFKMLEMHNSILNSITQTKYLGIYGEGVETIRGRDCLARFYKQLGRDYQENSAGEQAVISEPLCAIRGACNVFWALQREEIGHYYRYLYSLIEFVDVYEGNRFFYMKIIRAQLSSHELALLFYNCLSEHGEDMRPFVEKYALLKHLPDDLLLNPSHKSLISPTAFGEEHQPGSK